MGNGKRLFLWIGQQCGASWLTQSLGVASFHSIDVSLTSLPILDTDLSRKLHAIVKGIQNKRRSHLALTVVKQKDKSEQQFLRFMVEDESPPIESYVNYLCSVHRRIQTS